MKNECNIVRDLLPLYIENMASEETREFVEAHLSKCPECNELYLSMTEKGKEEIADEEAQKKILPLRIVKRKLLCKKIVASAISVVVLLLVIIMGVKVYKFVDGHNKNTYIDYGTSEIFHPGEMMEVVYKQVLPQIYGFGFGYEILSIKYAGDEDSMAAQEDMPDCYDTCMVFNVEIKTPAWADPSWGFKPNTYYEDIEWHVFMDRDNGITVQIWDPPYIPPEK